MSHAYRGLARRVFWIVAVAVGGLAGGGPARSRAAEPGRLRVEPALLAPRAAPESQLVRLRFDDPAPAGAIDVEVQVAGRPAVSTRGVDADAIIGGYPVPVGGISAPTEVSFVARQGDWRRQGKAELRPLRPWTLYLVQHTHTDVGYTALPSRLAADHLGFLDEAVRACALTDTYPESARFRWTCEGTWAVERYLKERPAPQREAFLARVRQGRIDVTAMRMNMTDLAHEELLIRNLLPVRRLRRLGVPIRSALQCDVNGYPWALPELLQQAGITAIAGGINQTRSTLPFEFPRAIGWESPGGSRVTAWRGEHYMFANFMGFQESIATVISKLPRYLRLLENRGYPYRIALLQMAGYFTDNSAPCHRVSDLVRDWNDRFASPRVRLATLSEWFAALADEEPPPAYRKAWPDWWADGVGSAPLETGIVRNAQETLGFAESFLALARPLRDDVPDRRADLRDAYLNASLYDEHTFGAAESISRPGSINTKSQWKEKHSYAFRVRWIATRLLDAVRATWGPAAVPAGEPGIVVFNSLPWERDGPVRAEVPRGIVEKGTPFAIVDPTTDAEVAYQLASRFRNYREIELVARSVPPVGYKRYRLVVGRKPSTAAPGPRAEGTTIENALVRVTLDPARAAIASVKMLADGQELVDPSRHFGFNQYVHERIVDEKGRSYLWPMAPVYRPEAFRRFGAASAEVRPGARGPARGSLVLRAKLAVPSGEVLVESEISLWRGLAGVWISNRIETTGTEDAVAGYFSFPFAGDSPPRAEVAGGVMVPGRDQIPLSAEDWHAIQRWVRVARGDGGAAWVTPDAPLVQFGGFNTGHWTKGLSLEEPVFHSWVLNNYWFTNFVAVQRGEFRFHYAVAGGEAGSSDLATHRFARGVANPLRAVVLDGTGPARAPSALSLVRIEPSCVDLIGIKEAEEGERNLVLHLRNRSEKPAAARVTFAAPFHLLEVARTDVLEEAGGDLPTATRAGSTIETEIAPWRLATLRIVCRR